MPQGWCGSTEIQTTNTPAPEDDDKRHEYVRRVGFPNWSPAEYKLEALLLELSRYSPSLLLLEGTAGLHSHVTKNRICVCVYEISFRHDVKVWLFVKHGKR